jgi:hypothetical protein
MGLPGQQLDTAKWWRGWSVRCSLTLTTPACAKTQEIALLV